MGFNPQVWGDEDIQDGGKKYRQDTAARKFTVILGKMWFVMIGRGFTGQAWLGTPKSCFVRTTKLRLKSFI